ncbi:hypothetical protein BUALT_Bualt03G0149400 [Buddleja alternifolia]|uniref:Uncharacterized protein n=1 Tax=Buddleja alternifolia TaxID=168488 RepID=A0AAV6XUU1_9LAMI|nr:hypothetical protein BUALT_Bualt03G0149400 [Buddleja alternifolia]
MIEAKSSTRTESAKIRNRRFKKKFSGTSTKLRLSMFGSGYDLELFFLDSAAPKRERAMHVPGWIRRQKVRFRLTIRIPS